MVLETFLNIVFGLINGILSIANIPSLGNTLDDVLSFFNNYVFSAFSFINIFMPLDFVLVLLLLVVAVNIFYDVYEWCRFIIRKIPFLNIS